MLKAPQFMTRYANWKIDQLEMIKKTSDNPISYNLWKDGIAKINDAIWMYQQGFLTIEETMTAICAVEIRL